MSRTEVCSRRAYARTCSEQETTAERAGAGPQVTLKGFPVGFCKQLNTGVLEYHTKLKFLENEEAGF